MSEGLETMRLWGMEEPWEELLYRCVRLYSPQIVLLLTLLSITIFRREISCNHCYAEQESSSEDKSTEEGSTDWMYEEETEEVLEGAGLYCSGASLLPVLASLASLWPSRSSEEEGPRSWQKASTEEILERASNFCSGAPLFGPPIRDITIPASSSSHSTEVQLDLLTAALPPDAQVHVLSFLHPKDVVTFACTSKAARNLVDRGETSVALWKKLWYRDYAWVVNSWDVGRQALQRSGAEPHFDKKFYFCFALSYMNYVLAGQNTPERCLFGLHGHIYDITPFLMSHPGSPETVMVQAGKDASSFFETVRHSMGARRLAQSLCVVVDRSKLDAESCGLRPTAQTKGLQPLPPALEEPPVERTRGHERVETLQKIYDNYLRQEELNRREADRRWSDLSLLGQVNVYYDPFQHAWKAWYTDANLESIFQGQL